MQRRTIGKNKNITIHQKVTKIKTNQYKKLQMMLERIFDEVLISN